MPDNVLTLIVIICCIVPIYFLPTIIALARKHHYKWVILAINMLGMTGFGYVIAFVWAVWPRQTAIFDLVANDPTTNAAGDGQKIYRQLGANVRAYNEARDGEPITGRYCSQCGVSIAAASKFCAHCGLPITPP